MIRPNWHFIVLRLSEAGSYRAIATVLLSIGIQIPDPIWQHIVLAGTGVFGLVGVLLPELASPNVTHDQIESAVLTALAKHSAPTGTAPERPSITVPGDTQ